MLHDGVLQNGKFSILPSTIPIYYIIKFFSYSLGYRPFMLALQPQIQLLDKFVIQQESIPNIDSSMMQFNHNNIKDFTNFEVSTN